MKSISLLLKLWILICLATAGLMAGLLILDAWPGVGAQATGPLRRIVGTRGVTLLEAIVFTIQDGTQQLAYRLGVEESEAPWHVAAVESNSRVHAVPLQRLTDVTATPTLLPSPSPDAATVAADEPASVTPFPTSTPTPYPTPTPDIWILPPARALGSLRGEGLWQPYVYDKSGEVVGLRTFLQPDPERPYATVAIVAFDLTRTELHYVLGAKEPSLPDGPRGFGVVAADHKTPDRLLAAFNGGFMATHGEYGAMSDGITALPAKDGKGTVAIYENGDVRIGEWATDILPSDDLVAFRQNARLVVHNGKINENVYNNSIVTWGGSIDGAIVTWRSGAGISNDNKTLYYFAGPSMSMPTLAKAMKGVDVHDGILLDINPSWVHFTTIGFSDGDLTAEPLFNEGMETHIDRYLHQSERDFFYVTAKPLQSTDVR